MFLLIIALIVSLDVTANRYFLDDFYYKYKKESVLNLVEQIDENMVNISNPDFLSEIERECNIQNLSLVILNSKGSPFISFFSKENEETLLNSINYYIETNEQETKTIKKIDPLLRINYMEVYGRFSNGYVYIIKTPIDAVKDSAAIATIFLLYLILIILPFILFVIFISIEKITDPLTKLTENSTKIAKLDFSAKYEPSGSAEIQKLGENFNFMAEQLKKTINQLETANKSLKSDLKQKEETEKMRREFLSSVSHELKTPIAIISGYAETLKDCISDPEDVEFFADTIYEETQKLSLMVKEILDINKMEYTETEMTKTQGDLNKLLKNILNPLKKVINEREITLINKIPRETFVLSDEITLSRILSNYITNAIDHTPNKGKIVIAYLPYKNKHKISVCNTGSHIDEKDLPHIWEKFYKIDKSRNREFGGTGLGLAIVKASAGSLKEEVGVNNLSNGVEFFVSIT